MFVPFALVDLLVMLTPSTLAAVLQEPSEAVEEQLAGQDWEEDPDCENWDEDGNWIGQPPVPAPTSGEEEWYEDGTLYQDSNACLESA